MFNPFRRRGRISFTQLQTLYVLAFFLALHAYLPTYANSSFLETLLTPQTVGTVFSGASLIALFILLNIPRVLSRFGVLNTVLSLIALEAIALLTVGTASQPWLIVGAFVVHYFLYRALFYALDIFVESFSSDEETGSIRGMLLTIINAAILVSPLLVSFIIGDAENYQRMYLVSAVFLVPASALLLRNFRNFKDPEYQPVQARKTAVQVFANEDLFNIFAVQFLLRFFYAWMVIYTPIYLIEEVGFSWAEIGPIFTVMLLPLVLFQVPLGKIADKYLGEKELLTLGFIVISIATFIISFITNASVVAWMAILFLTRFGACMIEVLSESYFFKKIDAADTELVSLFRVMNPAAFVMAPLVSTVALLFIDIRYTFVVLAAIMLTGIVYVLGIHDTK